MSTLPLFSQAQLFTIDPPRLRPYQSKAIQTLRERVREGKHRILLVAPTGAGKMTMIAAIVQTSSVPTLFVCDAVELIDQCVEEELARVGITNVGVIRSKDERTNPNASVQVASIQTLARRDKPPAGLVLIDEAHLAASDSYLEHVFKYYDKSIILGFTATPTRFDNRPLGNIFECLEVVCTYEMLIKDGYIVAPLCYGSPEIDLSSVRIIGGDYDEAALGDVMREVSLLGNLVDHWQKIAHMYPTPDGGLVEGPLRTTFIFAVNIQHSLDICARFESAGVRIAHLDSKTPEKERKQIIRALGSGELEAVTNVGVLLKGVDIPRAKCVVHARPTQSIVLWRQSCGRILRPWHPGCPRGCRKHPSLTPLLIDHAGNIGRHGFPHEDLHWELTSRARPIEKKVKMRICRQCFAYLPVYRSVCPYCRFEFPSTDPTDLPEEVEAELKQMATTPEEMRRMFFDTVVRMARQKGYKPGFASAKFKARYGAWPPWEWSESVKASFASDPEWQANYDAHEKLKEKIAAIRAAKERAKSGDTE